MEWTSVKDGYPKESDGQILVTNGAGVFEIVWFSEIDKKIKKPFAFDDNDTPMFKNDSFTHWMPLPKPPK